MGRILCGAMAMASGEGWQNWQQRKSSWARWTKPCCVKRCLSWRGVYSYRPCLNLASLYKKVHVSSSSLWIICPCHSQLWWGQRILWFLHTSPFIPLINTDFPVSSSWFSASIMLCALVTGEQSVESPSQIAQDLKVLFSKSILLHCKLQYNHSMGKKILLLGRSGEETGQPSSGCFPAIQSLQTPGNALWLKKIWLLQDARLFKVQWGHCSLPTAPFPTPVGSSTPQGHWQLPERGMWFSNLQRPCFLTPQ